MCQIILCLFFIHICFSNSEYVIKSRYKRNVDGCGVATQSVQLMLGGERFERGLFPWMVAILKKTGEVNRDEYSPHYFCGGTLIGAKHILTGNCEIIFYLEFLP